MERKPRRNTWSKKAKLLSTLLAVSLLCTTIIPGSVFAQEAALETEPIVVETVEGEEAAEDAVTEEAAEEQPAVEESLGVQEEAAEEQPAATEETEEVATETAVEETAVEEEKTEEAVVENDAAVETESTVAAYVTELEGLLEQAKALDAEAEDLNDQCADIYDAAMAVYDEAYAEWEADAITDDEFAEVEEATAAVWQYLADEYGYDPYAISTFAEERNISYYRGDVDVYWDETDGTTTASASHITSLKLNNMDVLKADSSKGSGWSGTPSQVEDYYTNASTSKDQSVKLAITPADGYYVTHITVACCPASVAPYKCATWTSGLAYDNELSINAGGTITIDLSVVAFCHDNNNKENDHQYFILVQTAPLPSPLYVEYDYGEIVNILKDAELATTPFDAPGTWTNVGSASDYYGSFVETDTLKFKQTEYTQYMYRYAEGDEDDAADWTHTSNYVTEDAKNAAASAGYYFSHWEAQYYETCDANAITNPSYNNYTYEFSEEYGNPVEYGEGADVSMVTNVRLVAQWEPIKLKVTKEVDGLSEIAKHADASQTYQIILQNLETGAEVTKGFTVTGDGTLTYSFAASGADVTQAITPGTYKVVEIGTYNLTGDSENAYCTTTYPTQTVEVTADGTVEELKVLNTYSSTPATYDLTVQKTVSGNLGDVNKEFAFKVEYGDENVEFNLKKDGTYIIENIPVGTEVVVSESPDGYTYSFVSITDGVEKEILENGVSFTMPSKDVTVVINNEKNVTIDTNVFLDNTPYILALGVVLASGTAMIFRRRKLKADK